jgi:hypothetical protein
MGRLAALVVAVPLLAACGSSPAASASPSGAGGAQDTPPPHPAHCGPGSARTLASSAVARVYVRGSAVYGCTVGAQRQYQLGEVSACLVAPRLEAVAVAGQFAAYGVAKCGVDTSSAEVLVRRLSDGRTVLDGAAIANVPGPESFQSVRSIVVRADGAVAWISGVGSLLVHRAATEVHRADARGQVLLDSGATIALGSLRLHGSTISWNHGGATRTATLK